jgi:hypothetical protein
MWPNRSEHRRKGSAHAFNITRGGGDYGFISLVLNANRTPVADCGKPLPAL